MIKCSKCGREFTRESNKSMHEKYCDGTDKKKVIIKDKKKDNKEKHEHDLVMLNPNIPNQKRAISLGFSAYCKTCKELV